MTSIKNRKPSRIFKPNIFVIDSKTGNKIGFCEQKKANQFIEKHERPYDLICEFDKNYGSFK